MGDGQIFLKTSAPHSLRTTYQMNLLSARSISHHIYLYRRYDGPNHFIINIFPFSLNLPVSLCHGARQETEEEEEM
jgi:hypothetical protein